MSRSPARKGPADSNHRAIREAIEALGYPVRDLSAVGSGVEDLLVGLFRTEPDRNCFRINRVNCRWLVVECKVPPVRYTAAQKKWRAITRGWPRITATSAQDAVDQIRGMTE